MKIRDGFVSNSSSTSFYIFGIITDMQDLFNSFKILCKKGILTEKEFIKIFGALEFEDYDFNDDEINNFLNDNDCNDISIYDDDENSAVYIGRSPEHLRDNETGKQFKEKTNNNFHNKSRTLN